MKKTLIFDLDGTLLDTLADLHSSVNATLKKFGFVEQTIEKTRESVGNGLKMLIKRSFPNGVSDEMIGEALLEMKRYYFLHCHEETKPYPGIAELIDKLKTEGFKIAVVSNKADAILRELVSHYFSHQIPVVIGESPAMNRKPAPDMVYEALRRCQASAETAVYIGDSEVDLQTAENAGLPCLSVSWGFRSKEALKEAGAKLIFNSPAELLRFLNADCPCKRIKCIRYGDCDACRAHHHAQGSRVRLTQCERLERKKPKSE